MQSVDGPTKSFTGALLINVPTSGIAQLHDGVFVTMPQSAHAPETATQTHCGGPRSPIKYHTPTPYPQKIRKCFFFEKYIWRVALKGWVLFLTAVFALLEDALAFDVLSPAMLT